MVVRHWLFDLDDTLYPASSELFPHVSRRITGYIANYLGMSPEEVRPLYKGASRGKCSPRVEENARAVW